MRRPVPAAVVALLLALSGCGGGSKPLSRADFVKQANALCAASTKRLDTVKPTNDPKQLAATLTPARDVLGDTIKKLRGLTPPAAMQADFKTVLGNLDDAAGQFDGLIAAAQKQDLTNVRAISQKINAINAQTNPVWARLGLNTCAQQ